jgi:hypothetical protein
MFERHTGEGECGPEHTREREEEEEASLTADHHADQVGRYYNHTERGRGVGRPGRFDLPEGQGQSPGPLSPLSPLFSDAKHANRNIWVGHGLKENEP